MSFNMTGIHICVVLILLYLALHWGRGSWLGCEYCWPRGWCHPAGVGSLANLRVVLGTWPPLVTNVVNVYANLVKNTDLVFMTPVQVQSHFLE